MAKAKNISHIINEHEGCDKSIMFDYIAILANVDYGVDKNMIGISYKYGAHCTVTAYIDTHKNPKEGRYEIEIKKGAEQPPPLILISFIKRYTKWIGTRLATEQFWLIISTLAYNLELYEQYTECLTGLNAEFAEITDFYRNIVTFNDKDKLHKLKIKAHALKENQSKIDTIVAEIRQLYVATLNDLGNDAPLLAERAKYDDIINDLIDSLQINALTSRISSRKIYKLNE